MITDRQAEILHFICERIEQEGVSPTILEIQARFRLASPATVSKHLEALKKKGFIRRDPFGRSIEVLRQAGHHGGILLPVVGYISAGHPIESAALFRRLEVPPQMIKGKNPYLLEVRGDSMQDAGILDGDFICVESRKTARNGETVIALIDGAETTVKEFYKEPGRIVLKPRNHLYKPIIIRPPRTVEIQGVVKGSFRFN